MAKNDATRRRLRDLFVRKIEEADPVPSGRVRDPDDAEDMEELRRSEEARVVAEAQTDRDMVDFFESIHKQVAVLAETPGWSQHFDVLVFLDDMLPDPQCINDPDYMDEWRSRYMRR